MLNATLAFYIQSESEVLSISSVCTKKITVSNFVLKMRIKFINPAKGSLKYKQNMLKKRRGVGRGGGEGVEWSKVLSSYNRGDKEENMQSKGRGGGGGALSHSP